MDPDGVAISSDLFHLTAKGSEPTQLETVVSELQSVTRGTYGQYCGVARAAEMVGERWSVLILRDLLTGPKSPAELRAGLPRISVRLLEMRLKEMEHSGVVRRQDPAVVDRDRARYELTDYGRAIEDVLLALGRWGAMALADPRPEDIVTRDSLMVALRATFVKEAALGLVASFELHVDDIVVHATVDHGTLEVGPGLLPGADAVIDLGQVFKDMLSGVMSVAEALASGQVRMTGETALLQTFVDLFKLPALPAPATAG